MTTDNRSESTRGVWGTLGEGILVECGQQGRCVRTECGVSSGK